MGNDARKKQNEQRQQTIDLTSKLVQDNVGKSTALDDEMAGVSKSMMGNYNDAVTQNKADYGGMMGNYKDLYSKVSSTQPTNFSFGHVSADRPAELGEAYGNLRSAGAGYQQFADTGGYSGQDIQELRARGISPIRAAYGNTMMQLDRARSLGGGDAGAPNYIAAASRAQRELPGQMADATTNVNAGLADAIRQGKLAGLGGLANVGGTMGGLSSEEASRILSANLANSQGNLQAAGMSEQSKQSQIANMLGTLQGQNSLYGTTPGMSSMFGNQALNSYGQRQAGQANNQNYGLGLIDSNLRAMQSKPQGTPWWSKALQVAGTAAPYIAMAASDKNIKHDIKPIDENKVRKGIKKLNLATWKYDGSDTTHMGPMAQDVKKHLGIGDGKTIHLADIMGVMLAVSKDSANV
jgi:hypothetical protein